jgi:GH15 family glucan-1,4-alpha-glucosidase
MTLPIEDYAMIGNCRAAALVGQDGSIDWVRWRRFDSPACIADWLGDSGNGHRLAPKHPPRYVSRRYRPGTLVRETGRRARRAGGLSLWEALPASTSDRLVSKG